MSGSKVSPWATLNAALGKVRSDDPTGLRDAMALVYDVIAECAPEILQDFDAFTEADFLEGQRERTARILAGDIKVAEASSEIARILDATRLLRALEEIALEGTRYSATDRDEELEQQFVTTDLKNFVIPRVKSLAAIDGKPFLRRALVHHRIIPTKIGTFPVRLHRTKQAWRQIEADAERAATPRHYGAAFFPGLKAHPVPKSGNFTIGKLTGFSAGTVIDEHMAKARQDNCGTVVWSELTMPEASVRQVQKRIREQALDDHPDFRYLVVGSWHRPIGGMRNVAAIIGGDGRVLFEVLKWAKFTFHGRREDIVPGNEVHVLICEDEIVTVAVCKDFLMETTDVPYRQLNVDVAIVPSMIPTIGEKQTLAGHAAAANVMRNRFGTRVLVVAQPASPGRRTVGKVMQFPAKPLLANPVAVKGSWHLCTLEAS